MLSPHTMIYHSLHYLNNIIKLYRNVPRTNEQICHATRPAFCGHLHELPA